MPNFDNIVAIGIMTMLFLSGIMGIVFLNYVKGTMGKLDQISHIAPLLEKIDGIMEKLDRLLLDVEGVKAKHSIQIDNLEKQLGECFKRLHELETKEG